jgi:hypothetical protein
MDETKREIWAKRVERWKSSDLTAKEFAAEIGVNWHTLAHWSWRLAKQPSIDRGGKKQRRPRRTSPVRFAEVTPLEAIETIASPSIEIAVSGTMVVRVPRSFDADTLRRVLDVVRSAA